MLYNNILLKPLQSLVNADPNKILLKHNGRYTAAGSLLQKSKTLASNFSEKGLRQQQIVLLAMFPGEEFLTIFYALLMLRVKIAIIDNEMGKDLYEIKMKQLNPKWLIADSKLLIVNKHPKIKFIADLFKKNIPKLYLTENIEILAAGPKIQFFNSTNHIKSFAHNHLTNPVLHEDESEYENIIIYTSGTLSEPKAVVHTNHSIYFSLVSMEKMFNQEKNVVLATYLPHFILLGIACSFYTKIIDPNLSAKKKMQWLEKENVTAFFGAPHDFLPMIAFCNKNKIKFPKCLTHLIIGSAPVHKKFLIALTSVLHSHTKITCTYGMTEHLMTALVDGREKILYDGPGDLLGKIVDGVNIKISDESEIFVNSTQLFKRYFHQQEGNHSHASGDLGFFDTDKNLVLKGRKKDMIIRRNFNIYPPLYEDTIRKIPGIKEAVMVGIYDENKFDELVYLVVEAEKISESEIRQKLQNSIFSIDKDALPDKIVKMELPRCGRHNKIDKIQIVEIIKSSIL